MRKNFALLGATLVVCLVARPALASNDDIGQAFKQAAMQLTSSENIATSFKQAAMALSDTDEAAIRYTAALPGNAKNSEAATKPEAPAIIAKKKPAKKRISERLIAKINLSSQTMSIMVDGKLQHSWKISSGAKGYYTPRGSYKPYYMTSMHYSKKYNNAPMPHSVFFRGGYAVHATGAVRRLGNPASHGCIRLSPGNARKFFKLVQRYSKAGTRIKISGSTPAYKSRKRYTRKKPVRSNSWTNYRGYGNNYVNYNARRRSTTGVRRIRINRTRQASRRRANSGIFNWQF